MNASSPVPHLAIVRAITGAGPYVEGDYLSVAFDVPTVGRLVAHAERLSTVSAERVTEPMVPETMTVAVEREAGPYARGDRLALSFVDPMLARIHPIVAATRPRDCESNARASIEPVRTAPRIAEPSVHPSAAHDDALEQPPSCGVRFSLSWSDERAGRFVQVADKLFTVDRLGWYRHAFAMRLLIPDEISCGSEDADAEADRCLRALRSAVLETLGRPLIAAFMPAFSVTPEWLDSIDSAEAARAIVDLRAAIEPYASQQVSFAGVAGAGATTSHGILRASDLSGPGATNVDALLPLLIATHSAYDDLTDRLTTYRQALVDLFGGTAGSPETVRLGQMTQPNHTLDDRLWQLVGTVSERFGGLAVA